MDEDKGMHFIVCGRVQGVFYRRFTQENALELGLKGWVRNLPDGRVEVMVYGSQKNLLALSHLLRKGPPMAEVTDLIVEEIPFEAHFDFKVR